MCYLKNMHICVVGCGDQLGVTQTVLGQWDFVPAAPVQTCLKETRPCTLQTEMARADESKNGKAGIVTSTLSWALVMMMAGRKEGDVTNLWQPVHLAHWNPMYLGRTSHRWKILIWRVTMYVSSFTRNKRADFFLTGVGSGNSWVPEKIKELRLRFAVLQYVQLSTILLYNKSLSWIWGCSMKFLLLKIIPSQSMYIKVCQISFWREDLAYWWGYEFIFEMGQKSGYPVICTPSFLFGTSLHESRVLASYHFPTISSLLRDVC